MQIPILVEPLDTGGFRARDGDPFSATAEGPTAQEAVRQLGAVLRGRLQGGARVASLDVGCEPPPLRLDPLPEDDWFFRTMREAIEEDRRREDEANP